MPWTRPAVLVRLESGPTGFGDEERATIVVTGDHPAAPAAVRAGLPGNEVLEAGVPGGHGRWQAPYG